MGKPKVDKNTLAQKAKHLAYLLLNNSVEWETVDYGPSLLDIEPGDSMVPDGGDAITFSGLSEVRPDGTIGPLSEETRELMRAHSDNIVGSQKRTIPLPEGWT